MSSRRPAAALVLALAASLPGGARAQLLKDASKTSKAGKTLDEAKLQDEGASVEETGESDKKEAPFQKEDANLIKRKLDQKRTGAPKDPVPEGLETSAPPGAEPRAGAEPPAITPAPRASSRRAASAAGSAPPPQSRAAQVEAAPRAASERGAKALRRAGQAAESFRQSLASPGAAPAGPAGLNAPAAAAAPSGRPGAPRGPNPAEPRTAEDVIVAAQTGFGPSIRALGYKVGPGPGGAPAVLTAAGRPAAPAEIASLGAALRSEPAALMRRPDFFTVLPRADFQELKGDYAARPAWRETVFKDIGLTPENRDFRWSASCAPLSGACNPASGGAAYRKGEDVPPEDLKEVLTAARAEGEEEDEDAGSDFEDYTEEDRREAAAADFAERRLSGARRAGPTLAGLMKGLEAWTGEARGAAGFGGEGAAGEPGGVPVRVGTPPAGDALRSEAPAAGKKAPPAAAAAPPPAPAVPDAKRRGAAGLGAGLAAALIAWWGLRRRG